MSFLLTPGVLQQQANRAGGGPQYALEFDGVDDYVGFSASPIINSFSVCLRSKVINPPENDESWFIGANISWGVVVDELGTWGGLHYTASGGVDFFNPTAGSKINDNKWHNFIITFDLDNNLTTGYLDGNEDWTVITKNSMKESDAFRIMRRPSSGKQDYMNGIINEVRIYNRVLTQSEITTLSSDIKGGPLDSLKIRYPFNEGSGNVLKDVSDNENHGTIYGANWIEL